ncbi:MAG: hypothetical protein U9O06_07255, partial [Euryarchaeota archaeon]|nr:hypothetical protein [Euryarchaeota archaeon]
FGLLGFGFFRLFLFFGLLSLCFFRRFLLGFFDTGFSFLFRWCHLLVTTLITAAVLGTLTAVIGGPFLTTIGQ